MLSRNILWEKIYVVRRQINDVLNNQSLLTVQVKVDNFSKQVLSRSQNRLFLSKCMYIKDEIGITEFYCSTFYGGDKLRFSSANATLQINRAL